MENIIESRIPKITKSNSNWIVGVWLDRERERNTGIKEVDVNDILVNPNIVKTIDEELRYMFTFSLLRRPIASLKLQKLINARDVYSNGYGI